MKQYKDTPYYITEDGKVFRNDRELKGGLTPKGYKKTIMSINGKQYTVSTHKLVAECYIPNPNKLPEINHIDGNKLNNIVSNLEWCTHKQNCEHRDNILNKRITGEKCGKSILTTEDVLYIRANYQTRHAKYGSTPLSKKFNVANRTILSIVKNERWKHL